MSAFARRVRALAAKGHGAPAIAAKLMVRLQAVTPFMPSREELAGMLPGDRDALAADDPGASARRRREAGRPVTAGGACRRGRDGLPDPAAAVLRGYVVLEGWVSAAVMGAAESRDLVAAGLIEAWRGDTDECRATAAGRRRARHGA